MSNIGAIRKIRNAGGVGGCSLFYYDALRKYGGCGSKSGALRNANEKIENALICKFKKRVGL